MLLGFLLFTLVNLSTALRVTSGGGFFSSILKSNSNSNAETELINEIKENNNVETYDEKGYSNSVKLMRNLEKVHSKYIETDKKMSEELLLAVADTFKTQLMVSFEDFDSYLLSEGERHPWSLLHYKKVMQMLNAKENDQWFLKIDYKIIYDIILSLFRSKQLRAVLDKAFYVTPELYRYMKYTREALEMLEKISERKPELIDGDILIETLIDTGIQYRKDYDEALRLGQISDTVSDTEMGMFMFFNETFLKCERLIQKVSDKQNISAESAAKVIAYFILHSSNNEFSYGNEPKFIRNFSDSVLYESTPYTYKGEELGKHPIVLNSLRRRISSGRSFWKRHNSEYSVSNIYNDMGLVFRSVSEIIYALNPESVVEYDIVPKLIESYVVHVAHTTDLSMFDKCSMDLLNIIHKYVPYYNVKAENGEVSNSLVELLSKHQSSLLDIFTYIIDDRATDWIGRTYKSTERALNLAEAKAKKLELLKNFSDEYKQDLLEPLRTSLINVVLEILNSRPQYGVLSSKDLEAKIEVLKLLDVIDDEFKPFEGLRARLINLVVDTLNERSWGRRVVVDTLNQDERSWDRREQLETKVKAFKLLDSIPDEFKVNEVLVDIASRLMQHDNIYLSRFALKYMLDVARFLEHDRVMEVLNHLRDLPEDGETNLFYLLDRDSRKRIVKELPKTRELAFLPHRTIVSYDGKRYEIGQERGKVQGFRLLMTNSELKNQCIKSLMLAKSMLGYQTMHEHERQLALTILHGAVKESLCAIRENSEKVTIGDYYYFKNSAGNIIA